MEVAWAVVVMLPPRHARACPGHPRRAASGPVSERAAAVRCALRHGPAWVAGTSPARTAESVRERAFGRALQEHRKRRFPRTVAAWRSLRRSSSRSPASCPGLSRAPTPCRGRTDPGEGRSRSVRPAARSGVAGRDKPGQDGGAMRGRAFGQVVQGHRKRRFPRTVAAWRSLRRSSSRSPRVMPGPVPGTHAVPRPDRSRRGPQPIGAPCGTVRRGWPGQARPGRRNHEGTSLRAGPSRTSKASVSPDRGGMEVASAVVLTLPRVMPGPVPGIHAVPRPDRSRRGPQPFGAPCGTVRRGWPGQARPGRRNHEGTSLRAGPSRASKASIFPDRDGMDVAWAVVVMLPRVMPGPVPGTHAVPRPDRSRRGPQPFGGPFVPVRRGWPGQARPGRRNHERASLRGTSRDGAPGAMRRPARGSVPATELRLPSEGLSPRLCTVVAGAEAPLSRPRPCPPATGGPPRRRRPDELGRPRRGKRLRAARIRSSFRTGPGRPDGAS